MRGYCGRFAPTPSGALHFGSLVTALGSFLRARSQDGRWIVRIDDLDSPRAVAGASAEILHTLDAYCLHWDDTVQYQSSQVEAYRAALHTLQERDLIYGCACSRRELGSAGQRRYPGTCRNALPAGRTARALRLRCEGTAGFLDGLQGVHRQDLSRDVGDFVVRRADGQFAYHLAVVVDDAQSGITEVVRGSDLLACTPRQVYLHGLLGLPTPRYLHLPVAVNEARQKLSKQTRAHPLDRGRPGPSLVAALSFLRQDPPAYLSRETPGDILGWAIRHWHPERIGPARALPAPPGFC